MELDGDEVLALGLRVELQDESGLFAATLTSRVGERWEFTIQP